MLTKLFLFVFFSVGCSQILENEDAVKSDDDDKNLIINISQNNITQLQENISNLEQINDDSAKNISELMEKVPKLEKEKDKMKEENAVKIKIKINRRSGLIVDTSTLTSHESKLGKEKENCVKKVDELLERVSKLERVKSELENEISERKRWENSLIQYRQELEKKEYSFKEFRTRLDNEYEQQYKLRLDLEKTKKEMYNKFLQLQDQQLQVSQCMNDVTFSENENERVNAKIEYHLAVEEGKNILYTCRSITDTGRNYLYKCLSSLNTSFIPDPNIETEKPSEE